ncbi:MAG: thioredoxin domain-containing protein [Myxococcales bacterium]|nr:thioredoxin domain-containing protein [Myxococcales bacterium]
MAKKILVVLFVFSVLFLGFSLGRFTNLIPTSKMSMAAKENAEFKQLDETQQAIALAGAASSPEIAKEIIKNLEKKGDLPKESFQKIMALARGVSSGNMQAAQKPQQPTLEDIMKDVKNVEFTPNAFTKGKKDAPVTLVMFTELMCPFCGRLDPVIEDLMKEYGDKIRVVFQTRLIHGERAAWYHRAAWAAGQQGKFWEFAEELFKTQSEWTKIPQEEAFEKVITPKAKALGLNLGKLKKDMESDAAKKAIEAENAMGDKMEVRGTPTVFINGRMVRGARDKDTFKQIIDQLLQGKS